MESSTTLHSNGLQKANRDQVKREAILAYMALAALAVICGLACFAPPEKVVASDQIALVFLAVILGVVCVPAIQKLLDVQPGATTFTLTAAMFVVYSIARRYASEKGGLTFTAMPDDKYVIPYSAYVAVFGALATLPLWLKYRSDWLRGVLAGLTVVTVFSLYSFWLLSQHYTVGVTDMVDPSKLPHLVFMLVEYGCVALLCRAVTSNSYARRYAIRFLPLALLVLWARFHFFQPPPEAESAE